MDRSGISGLCRRRRMSEKKRVHYGPIIPLCDDLSDVKVFVFGNLWWPRPKEGSTPEHSEWALYWSIPAILRRYGIGITQGVRRSIERESHWRENDGKFRCGLNQLCGALLQADFIECAVVYVKQERWVVEVEISRWFDEREMRVRVAWYNFHAVVSDNFLDRVGYDLQAGRAKLESCEARILGEEDA